MRNLRTSKREQAERTRARLLQAAIAVFALKGYDETAVEYICLAAGRARGAFYLHFRSRADAFLAAVRANPHHPRLMVDALALVSRGSIPGLDAALTRALPSTADARGLIALATQLEETRAAAAPERRRQAA